MIVKGGQRPNGHLSHREECGIQVLQLQPRLPANPLGLVLVDDAGQVGVLLHLLGDQEVGADDLHHRVVAKDPCEEAGPEA